MTADHVLSLRDAVLSVVRDGADLTSVLSEALGRAAVELGSVHALSDRDGREADALRSLAGWAHPADVLPLPREYDDARPGIVVPVQASEYVYLQRNYGTDRRAE